MPVKNRRSPRPAALYRVFAVAENQRELCGTRGALDEIRERFGSTAITRGVPLGRDLGQPLRLLPD